MLIRQAKILFYYYLRLSKATVSIERDRQMQREGHLGQERYSQTRDWEGAAERVGEGDWADEERVAERCTQQADPVRWHVSYGSRPMTNTSFFCKIKGWLVRSGIFGAWPVGIFVKRTMSPLMCYEYINMILEVYKTKRK